MAVEDDGLRHHSTEPGVVPGREDTRGVNSPRPSRRKAVARQISFGQCAARGFPPFSWLSDSELREIESVVQWQRLSPRELVVRADEPVRYIFCVGSGAVKLYHSMRDGRGQIVDFALPGDFIGSPSARCYPLDAEALRKVQLYRIPSGPLLHLLEGNPVLKDRFTTKIEDDLARAYEQMVVLGRMTALERVCSILLRFLVGAERIGGPTNPLLLPLFRRDIADFLSLTQETVSRNFSWLAHNGIIELRQSNLVFVRNRAKLEAVARGEDGAFSATAKRYLSGPGPRR